MMAFILKEIASGLSGTVNGTYNSKDVANATSVTFSGLSLTGSSSSNYLLLQQPASNALISRKPLSATMSAPNKTYDGTNTASPIISITSGLVGTETVTATGTATFNAKDVATANRVTLNTVTLADGTNGGLASNYSLPTGIFTSASINAKALSATLSAPNKTYDGTNTAAPIVSITSGLVGTETVTATGTATFNAKDVATANRVTLNTVTLADGTNGGLASNYSLPTGIFTSASINAKALSATLSAPNKTYDGTNTAAPIVSITSGLVGTGTVTATGTATFNAKDVATANKVTLNTVTLADGTNGGLASNYSLPTGIFTSASINAKALSATLSAPNKTYDGTNTASPIISITSGLVGTETVTATGTATFNSKDVATANRVTLNTVALADGANGGLASNYSLVSGLTGAASINAKELNATLSAPNKTYDGTNTASPSIVLNGLVGNENLTTTGAVAQFDTSSIGKSKTVNVTGITVSDGNERWT
jgi:hypothetical protein